MIDSDSFEQAIKFVDKALIYAKSMLRDNDLNSDTEAVVAVAAMILSITDDKEPL